MKTNGGLFLALVGCAVLIGAHAADVITTGTDSGTGAGHSTAPAVSATGSYVVFVSHANNLVTNDNLWPFLDVFVRDLGASTTTLVSVNTNGTGGGAGDSSHASISTNGQYVLFSSDANDLVANDTNGIRGLRLTNGVADIFLRDLISGATKLVSVNTNGSGSRSPSRWPIMTPDARFIVFHCGANDLVADDTNYSELFIRDMELGVTKSVAPRVNAERSGVTRSASVSADGRRVAFVSTATNLGLNGMNKTGDVHVRDLPGETTSWASSNAMAYFNTAPNRYQCMNSIISPDGGRVGFKAVGPDDVAVHVLVHDIDAGSTIGIATNSHPDTWPAFSADGRCLAFEENNAIYLRDLVSGTNLLVSVNAGGIGPADGISLRPVVTPDARYVAFISSASDLIPGAGPPSTNVSHVYVRDFDAGVVRRINVANNRIVAAADMHAVLPAIAAHGRRVAFDTDSADVVAGDNNQSTDVFVRDLDNATPLLVSVRHADRPARTGLQSAGLSVNSVSSNAQRIAFSSMDDPRVTNDTNGQHDVFVAIRTRPLYSPLAIQRAASHKQTRPLSMRS